MQTSLENNRTGDGGSFSTWMKLAIGALLLVATIVMYYKVRPTPAPQTAPVDVAAIRGKPIAEKPVEKVAEAPVSSPAIAPAPVQAKPAPAETAPVPAVAAATPAATPAAQEQTPVVAATPTAPAAEAAKPAAESYIPLTFDTLASFPFIMPEEPFDTTVQTAQKDTGQIPEKIKAYNEKMVSVKGFMLPLKVEKGLVKELLLMRDQSMCCYGTVPKINEWVSIKMGDQGVKPVMDQPVTLYGKLQVGEIRENGYLVGIYQMEGQKMVTQLEQN